MRKLGLILVSTCLAISCGALQGGTVDSGPKQLTYKQVPDTIKGQLTPICQDIWLTVTGRGIEVDDLQVCITQLANGATADDIKSSLQARK